MDEFLASLLVIGTQFGILVGIILLIVVFLFIRKKRNDKTIAQKFADDFKESSDSRKDELEKAIEEAFHLQGDVGKEYAQLIMKSERKICSNMLSLFNGKDRALLLQLQGDLANLTDAYKGIASMSDQSQSDSQNEANNDVLEDKIKVLTDENNRLKEDLKKALESIDYLQNQYTELFKKTNQDGE